MSTLTDSKTIQLIRVSGPEIEPLTISTDKANVIGRAEDCGILLADPHVSRYHATLESRDGAWMLTDLGSRHGTLINDIQLTPDTPVLLLPGDYIRILPFLFRVGREDAEHPTQPAEDAPILHTSVLAPATEDELNALAEKRLDLLMDGAASIHKALDERELANAVLELTLSGSGFARGMVIRATDAVGEGEVIASHDTRAKGKPVLSYSKSTVRQASEGRVVRIAQTENEHLGHSLVELSIHSAVGCPIMLDDVVASVLYLDSRAFEPACFPDAVGFCNAVARLAGLCLSAIRRAELERRQKSLEKDLDVARRVQQLLGPPPSGHLGTIRFASIMQPGRFVAGDLLDLFENETGQLIITCGDVAGQGFGAGILMSAVMSHVRAGLARSADPADLMSSLNRYLHECSPIDLFVTLFVGVFDQQTRTLRFVDAGHGHWLIRPAGQAPRQSPRPNGPPIGIDPEAHYEHAELQFGVGDRLVFYSDGVIEHRDKAGELFGSERLIEAIRSATSPEEDVRQGITALERFIAKDEKDDDTTLASLEIMS